MKSIKYCILFIVSISIFTACNKQDDNTQTKGTVDTAALQESITKFGIDLWKKSAQSQENVLISPLSVHTALSMAMSGAKNKTLEDMKSVLHVGQLDIASVNATYKELIADLKASQQLNISNKLFKDPNGIQLTESFEQYMKEDYSIVPTDLDFRNAASVDKINAWVDDATKGKVKKVIDNILADEVMFLINALYYVADWEEGFLISGTQKSNFTDISGKNVEVDMMYSRTDRAYVINDEYSAVDLDLKDKKFAMTFLLPKSQSAADWVTSHTPADLVTKYKDIVSSQMTTSDVLIQIPKFSLSAKQVLTETLKDLGMGSAFEGADFTDMGTSPLGDLYISRVLHDTYLKVDEKGVEGAAVTTVGIGIESVPEPIYFDRPFIIVLRHKETNIPIFIGHINKI